jgi:excisionase family DNA binding protein
MAGHPAPTFLKPDEVAKRWRLGRSTVYELLQRGELPYFLLGKTIRVALADVEAYETAGRVEAPVIPLRVRRRVRPG